MKKYYKSRVRSLQNSVKSVITLGTNILVLMLLSLLSCEELLEIDFLPPKVTITYPLNDSIVQEIVQITCIATDNKGISKVALWVDGAFVEGAQDTTEPYFLLWNSTIYENNSSHTITVRAEDTSGNKTDSEPIILHVNNRNAEPQQVNFVSYDFRGNQIVLTWNSSPDYDFGAYTIYRASSKEMLDKSPVYTTESVHDTVVSVENSDLRNMLYFQLCVQDSSLLATFSEILPVFSFYHGLVGFYPFAGNLNDESDFALHGIPYQISYVSNRFGNPERAGYFHGQGAFVEIPNSPETDFDAMQDSYTFSFWINSFLPARCFILEKWNGNTRVPYPILIWADTTTCAGAVYDASFKYESSFGYATDGNWHLITLVIDNPAKLIHFYVDATLVGTTENKTNVSTNNGLNYKIGRATINTTRNFKGMIDDFSIYKRALSADEITSLRFLSKD